MKSGTATAEDKLHIIVTGCNGGVGSFLVARYLSKGHRAVGVDLATDLFNSPSHDGFKFSRCDITTHDGIKQIIDDCENFLTRVDLVVHAAGMFCADAELNREPTKYRTMWDSNFVAAHKLTSAIQPLLLKGRFPLVVFISSVDAIVASGGRECEVGATHDIEYAATKGALITLTRALAMKLSKDGIRVNAICPTIIRTPMSESLLRQPGKEAEICAHIPLGRICEPQDIAVAIECLYELRMTTAHVLTVDGGYLCY